MAKVDKYELPDELYYDRKDHLWSRIENGNVRVGLDSFGQQAAGTVAYIKLMPVGRPVRKGRAFGSLEAGKYIGPLRAPVNGKLIEHNQAVLQDPPLVNKDPYGQGWFVVIEPSNLEEDIQDLAHGNQAITEWLTNEIEDYRAKGLLGEEEEED
jgi:glycine cleavage system H protein